MEIANEFGKRGVMLTPLTLVFIILGISFLIVSAIWLIVPALYGLPWVPTRQARIRKALELANLQPGETFYDMGAGDGRVLFVAAKEFGAKAVGIEIGPVQCALSWVQSWLNGSRNKVRIRCGDFYRADMSDADVVFIYAASSQTSRLLPLLERQLRPGARVVSISSDFPNWQPNAMDREALIFVYEMPPTKGNITSFLETSDK